MIPAATCPTRDSTRPRGIEHKNAHQHDTENAVRTDMNPENRHYLAAVERAASELPAERRQLIADLDTLLHNAYL